MIMIWLEEEYLPEQWQEGGRWRLWWVSTRFLILSILLIQGLVVIVFVGWLIPFFVPFIEPLGFSDILTAISIWATFLLTFALITVYRTIGETQAEQRDLQEEMADIHDQQKNIMSDQEEWMQAGNRPVISIDRWLPDGNKLDFFILNLGMGGAKDLECVFIVYPPEESDIILDEIRLKGHLRDESNARAIPQVETPKKFTTTPKVIDEYGIFEENQLFDSISSELVGHDVVYSIEIKYEDLTGEIDEIEVVTADSNIDDEELTIEGLILNTSEVYSSGVDVGPIDVEGIDLREQ